MGLDMYLSASKYIGGGWDHVRNDVIHDPERKQPPRIVPKAKKPRAAIEFDGILRTLRLGKFEQFHERFPESNSITVELSVGYWRKANAVHQWFVSNVQEGVDDCKSYDVGREQLETLRDTCQIILGTVDKGEPVIEKDFLGQEYTSYPDAKLDVEVAKAALGTQAGFFFGSTEYDQWYIYDLENTVAQLDAILTDERLKEFDFSYRSSW